MPALAIPAVAGAIASIGVSAAVATFIANVFVYAASALLLNAASKALAPKRRSNAGIGSGQEINYFDTGSSIRIIYGRTQVGGMETIPPITSGANNRFLHKVLTIAGHVTSLQHVQFDTTTITAGNLNANNGTNSTVDGGVLTGSYAGNAFVRYYAGNSLAYTYDHFLNNLTTNGYSRNLQATARGISTAAITLTFNSDLYKSVPTFTFNVTGKSIYDPRLDASPGAAPTNPSFATANSNPALALADYLMGSYGGGYVADEIDWSTVVTAANYCDQTVAIPTASNRARYTCNGVILATNAFVDNVKLLVDSMLGKIIFSDGKWRIYAGSWKTPTFTIQQEDWVSGLSIRFEQGKGKRFNKAHCWYVDKARNYQRLECLPQSDSGYLAVDGEEFESETEQLLCDNEYEAQAKARLLLRQSRNQIVVAGTLPPRFQDIAMWDTGTIVMDMFGWASKTFRATNLSLRPDGAIDCVFAEEQEDDWDDLAEGDYNNQSITPLPKPNDTTPSEPPSFSASEQLNGTVLFQIGTPLIKPPGTRFQIIRSTNSANAAVGTTVYEGDAAMVSLTTPTSRHWFYSRAIANSLVSDYTPNTFGVVCAPRAESENRYAGELISDPEIGLSSEMGNFWVTSRTDMYSLSLAPVVSGNGGSMFVRPSSYAGAIVNNNIWAIPNTPYPRFLDGGRAQFFYRARYIAMGSSRTNYGFYLGIASWAGSGTLTNIYSHTGLSGIFDATSLGTGASQPVLNRWYTGVISRGLSVSLSDARDINSYPYALAYAAAFAVNVGDARSGDILELDMLRVIIS